MKKNVGRSESPESTRLIYHSKREGEIAPGGGKPRILPAIRRKTNTSLRDKKRKAQKKWDREREKGERFSYHKKRRLYAAQKEKRSAKERDPLASGKELDSKKKTLQKNGSWGKGGGKKGLVSVGWSF